MPDNTLETVDRIQFIKRSQELGFSLDEIATFLRLEDSIDRKAIRKVAAERLKEFVPRLLTCGKWNACCRFWFRIAKQVDVQSHVQLLERYEILKRFLTVTDYLLDSEKAGSY
jgi:DNA-binding transcriptional MerR regulator